MGFADSVGYVSSVGKCLLWAEGGGLGSSAERDFFLQAAGAMFWQCWEYYVRL